MRSEEIDTHSHTCFFKIECKDKAMPDRFVGQTISCQQYRNALHTVFNNERSPEFHRTVCELIRNTRVVDNFNVITIETIDCDK